jgi:primosomal protein N'
MYVVAVAPIRRGIPIDELSYFTKEAVTPGALVTVPLRGKMTPAIVIRSTPAEEAKAEIKTAEFALKKLERVEAQGFFPEAFVTAARATGAYFLATDGAAIQSLFPNALLATPEYTQPASTARVVKHAGRFILQAEEAERFATYKSHIREVFARGGSCFFVLPSVQEIEHAYERLEKGIQTYTFVLHSGLSKKELEKRWKEIAETDHPILIIGTPLFLTAPRSDIFSIKL